MDAGLALVFEIAAITTGSFLMLKLLQRIIRLLMPIMLALLAWSLGLILVLLLMMTGAT